MTRKKKQTEFVCKKFFLRDFRGRFIKKKATTKELLAGIREITIPDNEPVTLYVQLKCPETDFIDVWNGHTIKIFKTRKGLSLDPYLKTYKVLVSGIFKVSDLLEYNDSFEGEDIQYQDFTENPLSYLEVVRIRQSSSRPLVLGNSSECSEGIDNFGTGNIGIQNYGFYNKGIRVMGIFNTDPSCFCMFNKPVKKGFNWQDVELPQFLALPLDNLDDVNKPLKHLSALESFNKAKKELDWPAQYKQLIHLPNFDYAIFEEITGISKEMLDEANEAWKKKYGSKSK